MQQALFRLQREAQCGMFNVLKLGLEYLKTAQDADRIAQSLAEKMRKALYEAVYVNPATGVTVQPVFLQTE
jgi:hypothetical protein